MVCANSVRAGNGASREATVSSPAGSLVPTLAMVLAITVAGDAIADGVALPIPGAALGLAALTGIFIVRGGVDTASGRLFDAIAPHLPLFFVPAAAGVIANLHLLSQAWFSVAVAIVLGTALTLVVTGLFMQRLLQRRARCQDP